MRIVITGLGIWSPVGREPSQLLARLSSGPSAIGPIRAFDAGGFRMQEAAEVTDFDPYEHFTAREAVELDRATQMAVVVARAAWRDAGLADSSIDPGRIGLSAGVSGAGQYQNTRFTLCRKNVFSKEAGLYSLRNLPHFQTTWLAHTLGVAGPSVMFSCASAGSGIAIGYAMQLLRGGRCDVVVAGGSEMITITSAAGLDSLRMCGERACSPFSGAPGMTLGEGAAFFVLESLDRAERRGAQAHAELVGWAARSDAYDAIGTDPSGGGLARAISAALAGAGLESRQIGWIRASGTSNRDQDIAETLAVHGTFEKPPPISSFESCLGHANGAAPAIGLAGAIVCRNAGIIPPTLQFSQARPGCDLDYVPNVPRRATVDYVLSNSIAFGGGNTAVIIGDPSIPRASHAVHPARVAITGIGIISAAGCNVQEFRDSLLNGRNGISELDRWEGLMPSRRAGVVRDNVRTSMNTSRMDALQRFSLLAAEQAIVDARFAQRPDGDRMGAVVGLSRGSAQASEQFTQAICANSQPPLAGKLILRMGRFHVTSTLAHRLGLRGAGITISEGITAGLHALIHGRELLAQDSGHDAIVVVAADELGPTNIRMFEELGWLAQNGDFRIYDPDGCGMILGEGAVAVVLERLETARARGATIYASIDGAGITNDHQGHLQSCFGGHELERAVRLAVEESQIAPGDIDFAIGHGRGLREYDERELRALGRALDGRTVPLGCVNGISGVAEAASGLFSIAAAAMGLRHHEHYPMPTHGRDMHEFGFHQFTEAANPLLTALVAGSTESGNNAAVVLRRF